MNYSNFEIRKILEAMPEGSFLSMSQTAAKTEATARREHNHTQNSFSNGILHNNYIDSMSTDPRLVIAPSVSMSIGFLGNAYATQVSPSTDSATLGNALSLADPDTGSLRIAKDHPRKVLFLDKNADQCFREMNLYKNFKSTCEENGIARVITFPNLWNEYQNHDFSFCSALTDHYYFLKTASPLVHERNRGEKEMLRELRRGETYVAGRPITADRKAENKFRNNNILALHPWDFVLYMVLKGSVSLNFAEVQYKKFPNYFISREHKKKDQYASLVNYYADNVEKIMLKLKGL